MPLPWNYADLTEPHVDGEAGDLAVDCVVWNEPTGLVARCEEMTLELQT